MYMMRKIDAFLKEWRENTERKPLIVKGPRQIGKTESIRKFAFENYESIIEINFVEEPKYEMIVSDGYKTADIIKNISLLDPSKKFIDGKTLIFFDEIQKFPDIATSLKFFKQDGRFDIICSGSMLGINYRKIESNSVGYKTDYTMRSMDFEEFLWAKGYDSSFTDTLLEHMKEMKAFNELELNVGHSLFLDYCVLGGMPAVVREDSILEEDFFVRTAENLIPVEVKATNGRSKSLRTLINSERYPDIKYGIKFTGGNIGYSNDIYTFPYFCAFLLKKYLKKNKNLCFGKDRINLKNFLIFF